jgi:hypothetical protein
MLYSNMFRMT